MATKNEAWVDEWQSMSFCFCCHHFFSERLTATLLFDDHYVPPKPAKHREDNGKCLQDFKNFYSLLFYGVCYERHFMSLPLISLFSRFYQQGNHFMEVPYCMNFSEAAPRRWLLQHAIPHFGTCRDWSAGWVSVSLTSIWKMWGLHSVISYKYPQLSGKFSIPQLIEQIFYASALYS